MPNNFFTFTWSVPQDGYRWADAGTAASGGVPVRVLVEQGEPGLVNRRRYDPLDKAPALFRAFAETPPTEEGILAFANKWGALGESDVAVGDTPLAGWPAEHFSAWVRSISQVRQAVWVWNRLTSAMPKEQRELLRHVRWERDEAGHMSVIYDSHPGLPPTQAWADDGFMRVAEVIASDHFGGEALSRYEVGEVSQPARTFLCRLVNAALRGRVSPQLFPDEGMVGANLPVMASLRLVPLNLYACLWLQFAQAMTSDKEQRQCVGCGEWFEVRGKRVAGRRRVRADKEYCRPACRLRAYREKQDHARRLRAAGKKVRDIARELGAKEEQVKKWVANTRG
jgi:hypothetical protein